MTSINQTGIKLLPLINIALTVYNKENQLTPMQHVIHNLQMGLYWLREAAKDLNEYTKDTVTENKDEMYNEATLAIPTLFSTTDELNFIKNNLKELTKELDQLTESLSTVPSIQYKIQRGTDKVYESMFNNELAISYYKQITDARTGK